MLLIHDAYNWSGSDEEEIAERLRGLRSGEQRAFMGLKSRLKPDRKPASVGSSAEDCGLLIIAVSLPKRAPRYSVESGVKHGFLAA